MPASQNFVLAKGKNAAAAITKKRFVKLDTTATDGETVKPCDAAGELAYGVALFSVSAAELLKDKGCSVMVEGRAIVEASVALAVGAPVATTNDGRAKAPATGDYVLGFVDEPASGAASECSVVLSGVGHKLP